MEDAKYQVKTYGRSKGSSLGFVIWSYHPADVSTGGRGETVIVIWRDEGGLGGGEGEVALRRQDDPGGGGGQGRGQKVVSSSAAGHSWPVGSRGFTDPRRQ